MAAESSAEQAMQRPVVSGVSVRQCGHTIGFAAAGVPEQLEDVNYPAGTHPIQVQLTAPTPRTNSRHAQNYVPPLHKMAAMRRVLTPAVIFSLLITVTGCGRSNSGSATPSPGAAATTPPKEAPATGPAISALPAVDPAAMLQHIKVLSSNKFEGRAPGTRGEDLTVAYLETQFQDLGLQPGNPDGTYIQKVPLVGIKAAEARPLTFLKGSQALGLRWKDDVVAWTKHVADTASISKSDVIFAGYGVEAPEFNWNDFKDVDVKGKTIIVLVNDPPIPDPADASKLDPKTFGGKAMTYYGRWTYKFEEVPGKGRPPSSSSTKRTRPAIPSLSCRAI